MKKLVSIMLSLSIAAVMFAQPQDGKRPQHGAQDFEKIKAERVAFITSEVGLTAQEAEKFWPVYNEIEEQQQALMKAERQAYKELNKVLEEGGNVQAALDNYLKAKQENKNLHVANAKKYQKVLSAEKTAKLFTCEEKFRRQQIGKLGGRAPEGKGRGEKDGRPGKPADRQ